jgi:hypothetical protein
MRYPCRRQQVCYVVLSLLLWGAKARSVEDGESQEWDVLAAQLWVVCEVNHQVNVWEVLIQKHGLQQDVRAGERADV